MLYFAYGSNLWLQQMSSRCPGSYLVGRGVLFNYQWQINQRGFANVVHDASCCVHGLVYFINVADEARLDRSEGVGSGAYSKGYCDVVLYPAAHRLQKRPDHVLRSLEAYRNAAPLPEPQPLLQKGMLVYLSTNFVSRGLPHEEYIDRMNFGIRDAIALGVPPEFFDNVVRPLVPPASRLSNQPSRPGRSTTAILPQPAAASQIRRPTRQKGQPSIARRSRLTVFQHHTPRSPPAASSNVRHDEHKVDKVVDVHRRQ